MTYIRQCEATIRKVFPINLIDSYYVEGTHYFRLRIGDLSDEENRIYKDVYLNLETEEVVDFPKDTKFGMNDDISDTARITNYDKIIDSKG